MNARTLTLSLLLGLPAVGLLAFGPRGQTYVPPGRTVVRYWEKWTGVEGAAIQRLVNKFNDTAGKDTGIFVDYHAVSDVEKRMLISTAGGDPPDVAGLFDHIVPQFADQNALLPLDELVREHGIDLGVFKPIWIEVCRFKSTLFALPSTPYTIGLYYNRAAYRDAGLDPDKPPQTIAELTDYAKRLTRRGQDGRLTRIGFSVSPQMLGWWHWIWPFFFDHRPWAGDRYLVDSPASLAAYNWIHDSRAEIGNADLLQFESVCVIEGPQNPFLDGRLAMVFQGPWMTNWIRTYAPNLDYGVARFPSVTRERRNCFASTDVFVIPRGSKHVREAMIFLKFIMAQENHEQLCREHCKVSAFKSPRPEFFETHPNPHIRTFDALASSADAFGYPQMPMWSEAWTEALYLLETVLRDSRPVKEAAALTQRKLDSVIRDYRRLAELRRTR
ncbi:sn-glycerol-3-phosphate-binding periplasmic protein UgpB precursor [Phycisphaerae bacterium RAS1]|nr:sn-glycerol-3-phosphate-binding periplasmic protein UgpB precursor [Phycisphaerae bacterium RAS1]